MQEKIVAVIDFLERLRRKMQGWSGELYDLGDEWEMISNEISESADKILSSVALLDTLVE